MVQSQQRAIVKSGVRQVAHAVALSSSVTSIPSLNFTPSITVGRRAKLTRITWLSASKIDPPPTGSLRIPVPHCHGDDSPVHGVHDFATVWALVLIVPSVNWVRYSAARSGMK